MKTVFCIDGEKVTRKSLSELVGNAVVRELVTMAKEAHYIKHQLQSNFCMGSYGIITVHFEDEVEKSRFINM